MASFVGLLAVVLLQLGGVALTSPASLTLAGAFSYAPVQNQYIWIFAAGLAIWGGLLAVGLVVETSF